MNFFSRFLRAGATKAKISKITTGRARTMPAYMAILKRTMKGSSTLR